MLPVACVTYWFDVRAAKSLLLGAAVFALPNLLFTLYTFRYRGAAQAVDIYRSFKFGELVKLILATLGFALVFKYVPQLNVLAFFGGFVAMLLLQLLIAGSYLYKTL